MKRLHLFEFEDLSWFPSLFRDAGTSYLEFVSKKFRLHEAMAPVISEALRTSGTSTIVDLGSGGGGPVIEIAEIVRKEIPDLQVVLTDKFPNVSALRCAEARHPEFVRFVAEPVDALHVPPDLRGLRTLFNAFHHFSPESAKQILTDTRQAGQPIVIFEASERRWRNVLSFLPIFILVLFFVPFLRPFRWQWLFFTYLMPIIPLFIAWDGVVSHLRSYSDDELLSMAEGWNAGYRRSIVKQQIGKTKASMTAFVGVPHAL